jgi:hypothetical protein
MAAARVKRRSAVLEVSLGSVAVILDFMKPVGAAWGNLRQRGQARLYKLWKTVSGRGFWVRFRS